jgi:hypothetical protein
VDDIRLGHRQHLSPAAADRARRGGPAGRRLSRPFRARAGSRLPVPGRPDRAGLRPPAGHHPRLLRADGGRSAAGSGARTQLSAHPGGQRPKDARTGGRDRRRGDAHPGAAAVHGERAAGPGPDKISSSG